MNRFLKFVLISILGFSMVSVQANSDPKVMLEKVASKMVTFLEANKSRLEQEPELAKALVKKELLPYIDEEGLGRRVLATHWKEASDKEQKEFVSLFINLVIETYAKGLSQYNGQTFTFEDTELNSKGTTARVKSEMKQKEGTPIKIDYLLKQPQGMSEWRVVDVSIEGISMVQSYRNQFSLQIKKDGLQSVIEKLAKNEIKLEN